ncbi:hypothetical protein ACLB2K_018588 [Fragaria x ananassa]
MKENDVKPDVVTYTTLMKALIRVDKFYKVPDVYEEMIHSRVTPDRKARAMLRVITIKEQLIYSSHHAKKIQIQGQSCSTVWKQRH